MKTSQFITEFIKSAIANPVGLAKDQRGIWERDTKEELTIMEHVNSFHPHISHCNREHAPNREYLDPELSVNFMWQDPCRNPQFKFRTENTTESFRK